MKDEVNYEVVKAMFNKLSDLKLLIENTGSGHAQRDTYLTPLGKKVGEFLEKKRTMYYAVPNRPSYIG